MTGNPCMSCGQERRAAAPPQCLHIINHDPNLRANRVAQTCEHASWLDACQELLDLGIDINEQQRLACAIRRWGEELHHLRLSDPRYDATALTEKREQYEGQYERGTYPEELRHG